eukprot:gene54635-53006_t
MILAVFRLLLVLRVRHLHSLSGCRFVDDKKIWFLVTLMPVLRVVWWAALVAHWLTIWLLYVFQHRDFADTEDDITASEYLEAMRTVVSVGRDIEFRTETNSQRAYQIVLFLVGTVASALLVSSITSGLMHADISADRNVVLARTLSILNQHRIPTGMRKEVLSFRCHQLG